MSLSAPTDSLAAIRGVPTSKEEGREGMGKGKEGDGKGKEGRGGQGGKGRTPVPDCESAKVATLKCGGPPTICLRRIGVRGQKSLKTAGLKRPRTGNHTQW